MDTIEFPRKALVIGTVDRPNEYCQFLDEAEKARPEIESELELQRLSKEYNLSYRLLNHFRTNRDLAMEIFIKQFLICDKCGSAKTQYAYLGHALEWMCYGCGTRVVIGVPDPLQIEIAKFQEQICGKQLTDKKMERCSDTKEPVESASKNDGWEYFVECETYAYLIHSFHMTPASRNHFWYCETKDRLDYIRGKLPPELIPIKEKFIAVEPRYRKFLATQKGWKEVQQLLSKLTQEI